MALLNKDRILDAAKDFVVQGKIDKAIHEYEKILSVDPADMRVKLRIAELFAKNRQVQEAIKTYREVAESYTRDGFYLKAVTVFKSILRLNPSLLEINQSLAALYEKMGLSQDAAYQYEILANAYEQKGQYESALKIREKLTELFPETPTYRIQLAEAYQREDKKEKAIEQFEVLAGQYQKAKKEPKPLIDLYEKILPSRPENKEMLTRLVELYFGGKNYKAALRWLESRKQVVAGDPHLLSLQARMYGQLNQIDSARAKYQQLASVHVERGEIKQALEAYEDILVLLPEEAEAVKEEVEKIAPDSFQKMQARALERRVHREREEAGPVPGAAEKPEIEKPRIEKPKVERPKGGGPPALETLLKNARSALSLVRAYRSTGLQEEAQQEYAHAKEALDKILSLDPRHTEAKRLLQELEKI